MKNKFYALLILLTISYATNAQTTLGSPTDTWVPSDSAGFGNYNRNETSNIIAFGSKLFVTSGSATLPHKLFFTTSGHPGSWLPTSGPWASSFDINNTAKTLDGGGYLYIGGSDAGQTQNNGPVYRSSNGTTWSLFFLRTNKKVQNIITYKGLGATDSTFISYDDGKIYKGAIAANDPNNLAGKFRVAADLASISGVCAASKVQSSGIHNGKLYYGLDGGNAQKAQLLQTTDGVNFVLDTLFYAASGYDPSNAQISAITSYNGDLYIALSNNSGNPQLLKSNNDTAWTVVKTYNTGNYDLITDLCVANSYLYLSVRTNYPCGSGGLIDKYDGTLFNTSESGLFSDFGNFADMGKFAIFNNHLYYASKNTPGNGCKTAGGKVSGNSTSSMMSNPTTGQVWRTCLSATPTAPTVTLITPPMACPGGTTTATIDATASASTSYFWYNALTTATSGSLTIPYSYYVSIIDTNNCANTSVINTSAYPVPPSPIINQSGTLCSGNNVPINLINPDDQYAMEVSGDGYAQGYTPDLTAQMNTSDTVTIEMWVKAFGPGVIMTETDQYPYYFDDSQIEITPDDSLRVRVWGVSPVNLGKINYNTWYHVAFRYDQGLGKLDGFLNGVISPNPSFGARSTPWSNGYPLYYRIGDYGYWSSSMGSGNASHCQVREFRVWKSARTDSEISSNQNTNFAPATPGLVAYYKMNQGSAVYSMSDSSGNALNGFLSGAFLVSPAPTTYSWSPLTYLSSITATSAVSTPAASITYTITATEATHGCVSTSPVTVNIPQIVFGGKASICTPVDTAAYINVGGSYQTVSWTPLTHNSSPSNAWDTLSPTITTMYYVSAFDGVCTIQDSILIKVGPQITGVTVTPVKLNVCYMDSTDVSATIAGGTAPFTYNWYNGWSGNPYTGTVYNTGSATNTYSTNVNVNVTDAVGCTSNGLVSLNVVSSTDITGNITKQTGGLVTKGHVYLYPKNPGSSALNYIIPNDTISATGDYSFSNVNSGQYWLEAIADSIMYPNAMATYYGNAFRWDSSQVYTHGCVQMDTANITVLETTPMTGPGVISGYIIEDTINGAGFKIIPGPAHIFTPGGPIRGVDVKLGKNPGGGAAARTTSDSTGYYQFTGVAIGNYRIYVDIPNLPMDSLRDVAISAADTSVHNDYWVDSTHIFIYIDTVGVTGIATHATSIESNFSIFPNPAKGLATLAYELKDNSPVLIEIYNVMGEKITSKYYGKQNAGKYTFPIDVNALEMRGGVYIVNLRINNKVSSQRIVVIE